MNFYSLSKNKNCSVQPLSASRVLLTSRPDVDCRSIPLSYDRSRWTELAELGLIALAASEEAGGLGGSDVDLALVGEESGRQIRRILGYGKWCYALILSAAGKTQMLEEVVSGEAIYSLAWAEGDSVTASRLREHEW